MANGYPSNFNEKSMTHSYHMRNKDVNHVTNKSESTIKVSNQIFQKNYFKWYPTNKTKNNKICFNV